MTPHFVRLDTSTLRASSASVLPTGPPTVRSGVEPQTFLLCDECSWEILRNMALHRCLPYDCISIFSRSL
jgi:hypothetical protein